MKRIRVGNVHPRFFQEHRHLSRFRRVATDSGGLKLQAPEFSLGYKEGYLYCDDEAILRDIAGLIRSDYGTNIDKETFATRFDFSAVPDHVCHVNVGVCVKEGSPVSGWNGRINAIWYDDNPPGEVVNLYFSYSVGLKLLDAKEMSLEFLKSLPRAEALQRLISTKAITDDAWLKALAHTRIQELL